MKSNRNIYLAYGSNLNVEQMKHRCPDARKIGATVIENYKLNFRGTRRGSGVANIERCKGCTVPVGIWSITKADEESLDMYEGYPFLYMKDYLRFTYGEREYFGLAYIMRPGHPVMEPTGWYEDTIRIGYADFGIDTLPLEQALEKCASETYDYRNYFNGRLYSYSM